MYFCLCLFYYVMCCLLNISVSYSIVQIYITSFDFVAKLL